MVFQQFQNRSEALRSDFGPLKGAPWGLLWFLCAAQGGALGDLKIPDRDPWAPRWGPGGGEQSLWSNKMLTHSGQGFQNKKTLPVAATDTFLGKCCCGCREKQYLFLRKRDPPRSDPPKDSPKDPPRIQKEGPQVPPNDPKNRSDNDDRLHLDVSS